MRYKEESVDTVSDLPKRYALYELLCEETDHFFLTFLQSDDCVEAKQMITSESNEERKTNREDRCDNVIQKTSLIKWSQRCDHVNDEGAIQDFLPFKTLNDL